MGCQLEKPMETWWKWAKETRLMNLHCIVVPANLFSVPSKLLGSFTSFTDNWFKQCNISKSHILNILIWLYDCVKSSIPTSKHCSSTEWPLNCVAFSLLLLTSWTASRFVLYWKSLQFTGPRIKSLTSFSVAVTYSPFKLFPISVLMHVTISNTTKWNKLIVSGWYPLYSRCSLLDSSKIHCKVLVNVNPWHRYSQTNWITPAFLMYTQISLVLQWAVIFRAWSVSRLIYTILYKTCRFYHALAQFFFTETGT